MMAPSGLCFYTSHFCYLQRINHSVLAIMERALLERDQPVGLCSSQLTERSIGSGETQVTSKVAAESKSSARNIACMIG